MADAATEPPRPPASQIAAPRPPKTLRVRLALTMSRQSCLRTRGARARTVGWTSPESKIRVPLFAARTLNATGQHRATLSLPQERLRAARGLRREETSRTLNPKTDPRRSCRSMLTSSRSYRPQARPPLRGTVLGYWVDARHHLELSLFLTAPRVAVTPIS